MVVEEEESHTALPYVGLIERLYETVNLDEYKRRMAEFAEFDSHKINSNSNSNKNSNSNDSNSGSDSDSVSDSDSSKPKTKPKTKPKPNSPSSFKSQLKSPKRNMKVQARWYYRDSDIPPASIVPLGLGRELLFNYARTCPDTTTSSSSSSIPKFCSSVGADNRVGAALSSTAQGGGDKSHGRGGKGRSGGVATADMSKYELVLGDVRDINEVGTLIGKCDVARVRLMTDNSSNSNSGNSISNNDKGEDDYDYDYEGTIDGVGVSGAEDIQRTFVPPPSVTQVSDSDSDNVSVSSTIQYNTIIENKNNNLPN